MRKNSVCSKKLTTSRESNSRPADSTYSSASRARAYRALAKLTLAWVGLLVLFQNCSPAYVAKGLGQLNASGLAPDEKGPSDPGSPDLGYRHTIPVIPNKVLTCNPSEAPGQRTIRRLSKTEYRFTIQSIDVSPAVLADSFNSALRALEPAFSMIPADNSELALFDRLDMRMTPTHIEGYFAVAQAFASRTFSVDSPVSIQRIDQMSRNFSDRDCLEKMLGGDAADRKSVV